MVLGGFSIRKRTGREEDGVGVLNRPRSRRRSRSRSLMVANLRSRSTRIYTCIGEPPVLVVVFFSTLGGRMSGNYGSTAALSSLRPASGRARIEGRFPAGRLG